MEGEAVLVPEIIRIVSQFFEDVIGNKCRVLSVLPGEKECKVICEAEVDTNYTTRRGLGDIVEVYEVILDGNRNVTSFKMVERKRKAALDHE